MQTSAEDKRISSGLCQAARQKVVGGSGRRPGSTSLDRGVFLTFILSPFVGERDFMTRAGLEPATYGLKVRCSTS